MFSETFSFTVSPHPPPMVTHMDNGCSADEISPFTSPCPSPHPSRTASDRRDSRFDAYRRPTVPRHASITALTAQLQSQGLADTEMHSPSPTPSGLASPTDSTGDTDLDEGFYDGPDTPATMFSDYYEPAEVDPTLWDLSMSDTMISTSSPRPSLSLEAQALSSYTMRRRQRQALVRLQCLVTRTPDLAMLIEECHPSSLPLDSEVARHLTIATRSDATSALSGLASSSPLGTTSGRIEKDRRASATAVRRAPRMRKQTR